MIVLKILNFTRLESVSKHPDLLWLTLTDNTVFGLKVEAVQPIGVTALHNSSEDFDPGFTKKTTDTSTISIQ